jgi:hypothetical protein
MSFQFKLSFCNDPLALVLFAAPVKIHLLNETGPCLTVDYSAIFVQPCAVGKIGQDFDYDAISGELKVVALPGKEDALFPQCMAGAFKDRADETDVFVTNCTAKTPYDDDNHGADLSIQWQYDNVNGKISTFSGAWCMDIQIDTQHGQELQLVPWGVVLSHCGPTSWKQQHWKMTET